MNAAVIKALKSRFRLAGESGEKTLEKSWSLLKKKPAEAALFTMLAANIIKGRNSKVEKQI